MSRNIKRERLFWRTAKHTVACAAVDKIEDQRKPEDFIGHRKRDEIRELLAVRHHTTPWAEDMKKRHLPEQMPLMIYSLLQSLFNSNSHGNGHTDHGVVTCALSPWEASVVGFLKLRKHHETPEFLPQIDRLLKISFQPVRPILWTNVDENFLSTFCNYYIRSSDFFKHSLSF